MTEGIPGKDPEPTVLGGERDTIKDILIAIVLTLARPVAYLLIPPLLLYRGRPVTERLYQWRWVYAGFVAGTVVLSLPQLANGNFGGLLLAPIFHLYVAIVCLQVLLIVVPVLSVPASAMPPLYVQTVAVISLAVALLLSLRSSWGAGDVDTDAVSLDSPTANDEYVIPLTEVWESGGSMTDHDRRSILRSVGFLAGGVGAGLHGRPIANDLATTGEPIEKVTVDADREVGVHLAENPSIAGVVTADAARTTVASWYHVPAVNPLVTDSLDSGEYRVMARRGDDPSNTETVQEVTFEANS